MISLEVGRLKRHEGDDGGDLCPVVATTRGSNCKNGYQQKEPQDYHDKRGTERMPLT
jgi:hypothetical protein